MFCGWQDAAGHIYEYVTQTPDASAEIDELGAPKTIKLYPYWQAVAFPSATKDFAALNHGERLWAAIAIQNKPSGGTYTVGGVSYEVNWDSTNKAFLIYNQDHSIYLTIAVADTKQWTLYNGETITQEVADFNHDYSDTAETEKLGVTYVMQNLLTDGRAMNASYKHMFNFKIGNDDAAISDTANHSSTSDAALTHSHTATADEVTAGFVDITFLGQSYLSSITVTHSDQSKELWRMGSSGYYCGSDAETFASCPFYSSDLATPEGYNHAYKIGKMMQDASLAPSAGWGTSARQQARMQNMSYTFADFGGIIFDATGTDTLNTAAINPVNGDGKARIAFHTDYENSYNNFTEVSEGVTISVPVVSGDVVTVTAYGSSRNAGGWDETQMQSWANGTFWKQLPVGLHNTIVPACKKSSIGNRSYAIRKGLYKLWLLSNAEVGGQTTTHPYMDEGAKYPIFTDNNSRLKYRADGAGAVSYWWERSPYVGYSYSFCYVYTSGSANGSYSAHYAYGVCLGFCSGEATA